MILAGDLGATNLRLALYELTNGSKNLCAQASFPSADFSSLEQAIHKFLAPFPPKIDSICLGVPGPVQNGTVRLTNLPWQFSEASLSSALGIEKVLIVNDLFALGSALPYLDESDLLTLHEGNLLSDANRITLIAPGTGLGLAHLARIQSRWHTFPSEGGHVDFAPRDKLSIQLLEYLIAKFGRVSMERVLSGQGLLNIYDFLGTMPEFAEKTLDLGPQKLAPRQIAETGLAKQCRKCTKTLDIFSQSLGALAGNCVLAQLSTSGIYLGGGIPVKLRDKLTDGSFIESYTKQGRLSKIVNDTPVYIILNEMAGLLGAAVLAAELVTEDSS